MNEHQMWLTKSWFSYPYFNNGISILGREEDGKVKAFHGITKMKQRGRWIQEDTGSFTPNLTGFGYMAERKAEDGECGFWTMTTTRDWERNGGGGGGGDGDDGDGDGDGDNWEWEEIILVDKLNVRCPQTASSNMAFNG